jgi:Type IX secretion system protein PorV
MMLIKLINIIMEENNMKNVLRLTFLGLSLILAIPRATFAQSGGEAAVPFLLLAPDSRFGAIGESGGGLADNSAAIFWNPAGIAFLTGTEVSITHSNWLPQFNLDLFYDYLTYRQYFEELNGSITSSIAYMNFGQFVRTGPDDPTPLGTFNAFDAALTVGYATKLHPDWGIGLNFRVIHSHLSDKPTGNEVGTGTATSVSFDLAGMWRPGQLDIFGLNLDDRFSVGINLSNLGPKISYIDQKQADPIPTNFRLGFAFDVFNDEFNSLIYTLDFSKLLVSRDTSGNSDDFYKAIFTAWGDKPSQRIFL